MTADRIRLAKAAPLTITVVAMLAVGCFSREPDPSFFPATPAPEVIPAPGGSTGAAIPSSPSTTLSEMPEPYVDLEMVDAPVKLILQRLAEIGGLQLVIPANLNRTLSVQYVRVPVSVALRDVLSRAGLRLGTGPAANLPFDTVTVFYKLPANVDSMSAEAIMRRFGVSRAMAELIVKSRRP